MTMWESAGPLNTQVHASKQLSSELWTMREKGTNDAQPGFGKNCTLLTGGTWLRVRCLEFAQ